MSSSSPSILAVIPARYASSRFPGKPLVEIHGKPMLQHVWEQTCKVPEITRVIIATDDDRIYQAAKAFGAEVQMTAQTHASGTDRLQEVVSTLEDDDAYDWIMNVQGDEPFINPAHLQEAIAAVDMIDAEIITLVAPLDDMDDWQNPNIVKAVRSASGYALGFSRAPVPYNRDNPTRLPQTCYRHLGLYLYRREALAHFTQLPPSMLEVTERLEQLRALEAGMKIFAVVVDTAPIGIDTPDDLVRLLNN